MRQLSLFLTSYFAFALCAHAQQHSDVLDHGTHHFDGHGHFHHHTVMANDDGFKFSKDKAELDLILEVNTPLHFKLAHKEFKTFVMSQTPLEFKLDEKEWYHPEFPWTALVAGAECDFALFGGELTTGIGFGGEYYFADTIAQPFVPRAQLMGTWIGGNRVPLIASIIAGYGEEPFFTVLAGVEPFSRVKSNIFKKTLLAIRYNNEQGPAALVGYPLGKVIVLGGVSKKFVESVEGVSALLIAKIDL